MFDFGIKTMKSILCVIDFSESSINALKWAADMAQLSKSNLHIMYPFRLNQSHEGDQRIQFKKETEETALTKFKLIEKDMLTGKVKSLVPIFFTGPLIKLVEEALSTVVVL